MFLFSIFLLDDFQEEEKTEIMVISEAPIGKQKIFTEVNIQVLNWFSQALNRHFRVEIKKWKVSLFMKIWMRLF